jgi:hypothetical protein
MSDTHDKFAFLSHFIDEFHGNEAGIIGGTKLYGSIIQSTTKSVSL